MSAIFKYIQDALANNMLAVILTVCGAMLAGAWGSHKLELFEVKRQCTVLVEAEKKANEEVKIIEDSRNETIKEIEKADSVADRVAIYKRMLNDANKRVNN